MKRIFAIVLSAAFLATTTTAMVLAPRDIAVAQAEKKAEKKDKKSGMTWRDRLKKCSGEWKEAKAAGKTSTLKWPKFLSDCNKRLKKEGA